MTKEEYRRLRIIAIIVDFIIPTMLGLIVCLCITLLFGCRSTKIDTNEERTDTTIVRSSTHQRINTSTSTTLSSTTLSEIIQQSQTWWNAHIVRTSYALDSLGNRYVSQEETADIDGTRKDSTQNVTNTQLNISTHDTITIVNNDTLYIYNTSQESKQSHVEQGKALTWYYEYLAYIGATVLILALLYLLWIKIKPLVRKP